MMEEREPGVESVEQTNYRLALDEVSTAVNMLTCPYFTLQGAASCVTGCYFEPRCQTDMPSDGWHTQLLESARVVFNIIEKRSNEADAG